MRELVLVGGGHAHVQVLRRWAMDPLPGVAVTVVLDRAEAVYSGMVPGCVAGQYRAEELVLDVHPLARRAGATVVLAPATGVDPERRRIELDGRPPLRFDVASLDVGSTVAGSELPGVTQFALPTRPIARLIAEIGPLVERARRRGRAALAVVGAGAGGVELAATLRARLLREGLREAAVTVTLLADGPRVLPAAASRVSRRVAAALAARGVTLRTGARVERIEADGGHAERRVVLADGEVLLADEVLWVAGGAPLPWLAAAPLPRDQDGFVSIRPTLQVVGQDELFAVGDCAGWQPPLPKSGVFAVRQGPVLFHNLRARLVQQAAAGSGSGGAAPRLRRYRPQRDMLVLLNFGDGSALATKWGRTAQGRAMFALKDRIDRRFVRRFQVLDARGAPTAEFPPMTGMENVPCGGCAAKVGAGPLARALTRLGVPPDERVVLGLREADDVAAVAWPRGGLVVASVDAFRAFSDDAWLVGRVAATNAASDLWAKGVAPRFALATVTLPELPEALAEERLYQVLAGARAAFDADGVVLVGGHTVTGSELAVGFAVWGDAPERGALRTLVGLRAGDRLILTRPLGSGVLWRADMSGAARGEWMAAAVASMCRSNAAAAAVLAEVDASAATDVTGFGLAGHLRALLAASGVSARLSLPALPLLPGAAECLARGIRSSFHAENARVRHLIAGARPPDGTPALEILFDPQTGGGLLFGVRPERQAAALAALHAGGDRHAAVIGEVLPRRAGAGDPGIELAGPG